MAKDVLITPASALQEWKDTGVVKASILENNGNLYISTTSGSVVFNDGTSTNVEVGDALTSVSFTFLGGGQLSSDGNALDIGISGDTVNLNVTGVTYNWPSTLLTTAEYNATDVLTKIKTVDGSGSGLDADLLDGQQGSYYAIATHNHTVASLTDVTITSIASGEILKWNGSAWINNTLAEAGIQAAGSYLTAESDTLATVTGRGATTATAISLTNTTASTSTATGALTVAGGVGVAEALNVGGTFSAGGATPGGPFHLYDSTNDNSTLIIESANPTIRFADNSASATHAEIAQDANGLSFRTSSPVNYDTALTQRMRITAAKVQIDQTTASTSTTTGALTVAGGVGIDGALYVGGGITGSLTGNATTATTAGIYTSTTAPSSPTNGSAWVDTNTGQLKVYYQDGTSNQWIVPVGGTGPAGADGSTINNVYDVAGGAEVNGNLSVLGSITATGDVTAYSDLRLKNDIKTLDGKKVYNMRGVSFTKNNKAGSGVIAQELLEVAPELVNQENEYMAVAYGNIVGYLIEAIKELNSRLENIEKKLEA